VFFSFYRGERERREKVKKKMGRGGARGKQGPFQSLKENSSHKIRRKRRSFGF
jgi:hypothetical protein